jgi:hypothetical protein
MLASVLIVVLLPTASAAQVIGTFHWRLFAYCNTLTLTVIQEGSTYRLQGHEYLCDPIYIPQPVSGTAVVGSEGRFIIGLSTGYAGGFTFQGNRIVANLTLPTLSGGWEDDAGRSGEFQWVNSTAWSGPQRGAFPQAFLHLVTPSNRRGPSGDNVSCFSHPSTDNNESALISVTANRGRLESIRPVVTSTVSVYLHTGATGLGGPLSADVWCISRNDSQQMPIGAGFTVQVIPR